MTRRHRNVLPALLVGLATALAGWAAAQAGADDADTLDVGGAADVDETPFAQEGTGADSILLDRTEVGTTAAGETLVEECRAHAVDESLLTGGAFDAARAEPLFDEAQLNAIEEAYAEADYGDLRPIGVLGSGALALEARADGGTQTFILQPAEVGDQPFVTDRTVLGTLADGQVALRQCVLTTVAEAQDADGLPAERDVLAGEPGVERGPGELEPRDEEPPVSEVVAP